MRLIDALPDEWNQSIAGSPEDGLVFLLLRACLTFTYQDIPKPDLLAEYEHFGIPEQISSQRWFQSLSSAMSEQFYDKVYIERTKCREIIDRFGQPDILVMCGYAGTGKSTILRQLVHLKPSDNTQTIIYINAAKSRDEFRNPPTARKNLALELLQRLRNSPVHPLLIANKDDFKVHRMRHTVAPKYHDLLEDLDEYGPKEHADYVTLIADPGIRAAEATIWKALEPEQKLKSHLQYLKDAGHRAYLILDNLDRLPTLIQHIFYDYCQTLQFGAPALLYSTLALRTDNFHRLPNGDDRSSLEIPHDIDLSVTLEPNAQLSKGQQQAYKEITLLIQKRIDFCAGFISNPDFIEYAKSKAPSASIESLTQKYRRYQTDLPQLLSLIRHKSNSTHLLPANIQWHNSSIRSVCYHFFVLSVQLLKQKAELEHATATPITITEFGKRITERTLRTEFLRSVIFDNRNTKRMNVANVFSEGQTVSPLGLNFLPLKILQHIVKNIDPTQAFGIGKEISISVPNIVEALKDYAITESEVFEAIKVLRRPRDFDPYGLIYLDITFDENGDPIEDMRDARVFLLPSGYFFWNSVSVTCEYIFWCAAFGSFPDGTLLKKDFSIASDLIDDRYRLRVALKFCTSVILPRFHQELKHIDAAGESKNKTGMAGLRRNYLKKFGINSVNDLYISRAEKQLRLFWQHTHLGPSPADAEINRLLADLKAGIDNKLQPIITKWQQL